MSDRSLEYESYIIIKSPPRISLTILGISMGSMPTKET